MAGYDLIADPRFVTTTTEGRVFVCFQFIVLVLLIPVLWEPQLSYFLRLSSIRCIPTRSKFISKVMFLLGGIVYQIARVGYLTETHQTPIQLDGPVTPLPMGALLVANVAGFLSFIVAGTRLAAPWLANPAEINADDAGDNDLDRCRLCCKQLEPAGEIESLLALAAWIARLAVVVGLALDLHAREGKAVYAFGVLGVFLCAGVQIPTIWFTFCQTRAKSLVSEERTLVDPRYENTISPMFRAHWPHRAVAWTIGCILMMPVHLLREGMSY
jgi:hypothetical protein